MNRNDKKYLVKILSQPISKSSIPKSMLQATYFTQLINGEILEKKRSGNGWKILTKNKTALEKFINNNFPEEHYQDSKSSNVRSYRNSKASVVKGKRIAFIRGNKPCIINGEKVDLNFHTTHFNLFASQINQLETEKLCFVENLEAFLRAEEVINEAFVFIHVYGRVGQNILKKIKAKEVLVFSDYDFVGLHEYLTIQPYFNNTQFFIPVDYSDLFKRFSRSLSIKKERQTVSSLVLSSNEELVVEIREQVLTTQRFLEQEAIFKNHK